MRDSFEQRCKEYIQKNKILELENSDLKITV